MRPATKGLNCNVVISEISGKVCANVERQATDSRPKSHPYGVEVKVEGVK